MQGITNSNLANTSNSIFHCCFFICEGVIINSIDCETKVKNMVKEVIHDPILLGVKSEKATIEDLQVAEDLLDTLVANAEGCVGMAANMIGVHKRIICFDNDGTYMTMFNPVIIKKSDPYQTQEGCLSLLDGPRPCKRYKSIKVQWQTAEFQTRIKTFTGWTAQIIQHEIDHCDGILI